MKHRLSVSELKRIVHELSESDRAALRGYLIAVFDVRGRDTRVNLTPDERDRPRDH
jgi:LEA14-like dessication related protein